MERIRKGDGIVVAMYPHCRLLSHFAIFDSLCRSYFLFENAKLTKKFQLCKFIMKIYYFRVEYIIFSRRNVA